MANYERHYNWDSGFAVITPAGREYTQNFKATYCQTPASNICMDEMYHFTRFLGPINVPIYGGREAGTGEQGEEGDTQPSEPNLVYKVFTLELE